MKAIDFSVLSKDNLSAITEYMKENDVTTYGRHPYYWFVGDCDAENLDNAFPEADLQIIDPVVALIDCPDWPDEIMPDGSALRDSPVTEKMHLAANWVKDKGKKAIIGFASYGEAEALANFYGLEVVNLRRDGGWPYVKYLGAAFGPIHITEYYFGPETILFDGTPDEWQKEVTMPTLAIRINDGVYTSLEDVRKYMDQQEWILTMISNLEDNEQIAVRDDHPEVYPIDTCEFCQDDETLYIGVM